MLGGEGTSYSKKMSPFKQFSMRAQLQGHLCGCQTLELGIALKIIFSQCCPNFSAPASPNSNCKSQHAKLLIFCHICKPILVSAV